MRTGSPRNAEFSGQNEKEYAWFKISDSLPVGSIGAKGAARKIIRALISGDAEVHLGVASKVAAVAQGLAPGLVTDVLGLVDKYLMPDPAPRQPDPQKGSASESEASENILTQLTREAEAQNNQI